MADTISTQVYNGEKSYVITIENFSDGTGQSNVTIVNASTIDAGVITNLVLWKCSYTVKGGSVVIGWEDTLVSTLLFMGDTGPGMSHRDFSRFGGLKNPNSVANSGNIVLSTYGFMPNSSYSMTLEFRKMGVRTTPMPTLDLDFANNNAWNGSAFVAPSTLITTSRASTAYADNVAGTWTSFGNNVPRITNKGLLVEEARTNSIRNNSAQGLVVGSPGTPPTNVTIANLGTLTQTLSDPGTENGIDYWDIRVNGTTSTAALSIALEAGNGITTALNGQTWAHSVFLKIQAGSFTNITSTTLVIQELTSAGAFIQSDTSAPFTPTASLQRYSYIPTLSGGATVARIRPFVILNWPIGVAVDITLRIGWPQTELGSFVTSPIRTTSAAVTRAADVVTVTTVPTFGSVYSLFGAGSSALNVGNASGAVILSVDDNTVNNRTQIYRNSVTQVPIGFSNPGGWGEAATPTVWAANTRGKIAAALEASNEQGAFSGSLFAPGVKPATINTTISVIHIGSRFAGTTQWNGYIERVSLWPTTRLSNSDLARLTSL